ncbi:MAG: methyltransferase domain-containing protein [Planctomycetota bacterium]
MTSLAEFAIGSQPGSISSRMRRRRFRWFEQLTEPLPKPIRIIDLGGRNEFWEQHGWAGRGDFQITLVNIMAQPRRHENIEPRVGNAVDLSEFPDNGFDVAFSNSVIEHLATRPRQAAMAGEMRRVARAYWVQTPNYWFPIEPHFLFPGWQWMPRAVRAELLHRLPVGGERPCQDRHRARQRVSAIRLLSRRDLESLFPGAAIMPERFGGVVKSWIVHDGFPPPGGGTPLPESDARPGFGK